MTTRATDNVTFAATILAKLEVSANWIRIGARGFAPRRNAAQAAPSWLQQRAYRRRASRFTFYYNTRHVTENAYKLNDARIINEQIIYLAVFFWLNAVKNTVFNDAIFPRVLYLPANT